MYGINKTVYENLLKYFNDNKDIEKVILYGSRAKNIHRYNSDIDLCIDYSGQRKWEVLDKIDQIVGIYSVDILFMDSLNEEIEQQINRDGQMIYSK